MRVVVLGSGFWGSEWLRLLASVDGVQIAATASGRDPEVPADARFAPGYTHYRDYRDAIEHADADAVLVTLPTRLHADAILRSLDRGRHVLCEKPLAASAEETARLLDASAEHPELVVMVGQNYRRRPWAELVRAQIAEGVVGEIAHIAVRFRQPEMLLGARAELDNPLLQDMGIHHFDLLRFLSGRNAVRLYARQHRPHWSEFRGSPGLDAVIAMEHGLQVSYSGSWAGRGRETPWDGDWHIEGDRGLLTVTHLRVNWYPHPAAEPQPVEVPGAPFGDLQATFEGFRRAIERGEEPDTSIRDNCHSIGMVFAAEDAIRRDTPVMVESWSQTTTGTRRRAGA